MTSLADAALFARDGWRGAIDHELPSIVVVGAGTALVVSGWLYHEHDTVKSVSVRLAAMSVDVLHHSMPRSDVFDAFGGRNERAYRSGFWAIVPVRPVEERIGYWVTLEAETSAGDRIEQEIVHVTLLPRVPDAVPSTAVAADVVICMATHNPRVDLLERQVRSIRDQTLRSWHCIVSDDSSDPPALDAIRRVLGDDPRFELHSTDRRLGFYFNFESLLERVPAGTRFVALADQDDEWAPDKLATLRDALERESAVLAFSDQRITRPDGSVVSPTFWATRTPYSEGLRPMLVGNTVTGAASLFRGELLSSLLPLPPMLLGSFHDHWLALVALATGRIAYVDRVLSDYVQHPDQVLGHASGVEQPAARSRSQSLARRAEDAYFNRVLLQRLYAKILLLRFAGRLGAGDRRLLERVADGENSVLGVLDYAARAVVERRKETLGYHRESLLGLLWALAWEAPLQRRPTGDLERGVHPTADLVRYRGAPLNFEI